HVDIGERTDDVADSVVGSCSTAARDRTRPVGCVVPASDNGAAIIDGEVWPDPGAAGEAGPDKRGNRAAIAIERQARIRGGLWRQLARKSSACKRGNQRQCRSNCGL